MTRVRMLMALAIALAVAAPLASAAPVGAGQTEPVFVDDGLLHDGPRPVDINSDEATAVIVRLEGPTLLDVHTADREWAAANRATPMSSRTLESVLDAMERRQIPAQSAIEGTGAVVLDSYQAIANGFLVNATSAQIREIVGIPGIVSVARAPVHTVELGHSVPHLGADMVWDQLGYDGTGVNVAVIDTGVDYTHAAFGGSGVIADFDANDPVVIEDGTFPTAKVVGGYDLVGEIYSAACPSDPMPPQVCTNRPDPDMDPLDYRGGHGTHVSGIIASMGTDGGGVAKGVAPGANIVLLKVFGNPQGVGQSTTMSGSAIEWATMHNLDIDVEGTRPEGPIQVINLSLGSDWGGAMIETNRIVKAAVDAGITVVASAGNDGNRPYIAGSPGAADMAVGVGGTHPPGDTQLVVMNDWEEDGEPKELNPLALEAAADWTPQLPQTGPITGLLAWYGLACNDDQGNPTPPEQDLQEKIALIERGTCTFYDKVWNAEKNGAIAVVVFSDDREKTIMACAAPSDCTSTPNIPAVMIDRGPGVELREAIFDKQLEVATTLDANNLADLANSMMQMSSRGPSRFSAGIKPQIVAPGNEIVSAHAGFGTEGVSFSGTSMSGPHGAGVAALIWQRVNVDGLGMSAADVGALVINYADPIVRSGNPAVGPLVPVARQGAGRANAYRSASASNLVRSDIALAELSFGNPRIMDEPEVMTRTLTVTNFGDDDTRFAPVANFLFPEEDAGKGVLFSFEPEQLEVTAGMTAELDVLMTLDPETMKPWEIAGETVIANEPRFAWQEVDGHVTLTEVDENGDPVEGGDVAGVPFHVLPRRSSCVMQTTAGDISLGQAGDTEDHSWANSCGIDGQVEVYNLVGSDPAESATDDTWAPAVDVVDVGLRWGAADPESPTMLEWAISTAGTRRIPFDAEFHVYVDSDLNGNYDYAVFNVPEQTGQGYSGRWLVGYAPVVPGTLRIDSANAVLEEVMRYDIDESTSILQVEAEAIGVDLSDGMALFDWVIVALDLPGDVPESATYLGYDLVPDELESGTRFRVEQSFLDCFALVSGGDPVGGYMSTLTVPADGEAEMQITLAVGCSAGEEPLPFGFLMAYRQNMTGEARGETATEVRMGTLGTHSIYLPFAAMGSELRNPPLATWFEPKMDSGIEGPGWFMQVEEGVVVNLQLKGTEAGSRHPVKIVTGGCDEPGEVAYDVGVAVDGYLNTLIAGLTLDDIALGEHGIVVQLSEADDSIVACGWIPDHTAVTPPPPTPDLETWFEQKMDSGIEGPGWFLQVDEGVVVDIELKGTAAGSLHPVWIVDGGCDEPGGEVYYVGVLEFGYVHRLIEGITLDDFARGKHSIVVQKSVDDSSIVACGWIPDHTMVPEPTP